MGDATKPGNDAGTRDAAHSDASNGSDTGSSQDTGTSKETGVVDANMGDTFDPLCGNGTIDPGEQCDDGNHLDLDGCSSSCQYEMVTRMTSISISGSAGPSFCVHSTNALGAKAITSTALGQLNPPLLKDVTDGTVNVLTQFFALSDLTGVTGTGLEIGVVDGKPDPAKGTWPTTGNPLDWWFLADPTAVSKGLPIGLLGSGALAAGVLTAGPSTVNVDLTLGGSLAALTMRDAKIVAMIDATPAPDVPAPPPTKLATGLVVFQTLTATGAGQGLCGDITVQSLAQIPVPMALTTGTTNCSEGYTYCGTGMPVSASCNSLLDVIVGGCKVVGGLITAVKATQPDVPPTGGTSVATLKVGSSKKVTIPTGDEDEAYSAYLQFAANRAHFTGESCTTASQCQSGQACTASVCK
jgi:cysteine-rich repeat protein